MSVASDTLVVTVPEAARLLRIGRNTAYGLVRDGQLRAVRVGRRVLVPRKALGEWLRRASSDTSPH